MPCIEHVALHVSPSVLCTQKHVLHDCLQGFCKNVHGTWCPKSVIESPCRKISRESSGLGYLSRKKLCLMLSPSHDQSQRRDNMLKMDISEVRCSQYVFGVCGAQQGGCSSKLLLESGIRFLPHSPPSSSRPCMGNPVCFFLQSISLFHLTTL